MIHPAYKTKQTYEDGDGFVASWFGSEPTTSELVSALLQRRAVQATLGAAALAGGAYALRKNSILKDVEEEKDSSETTDNQKTGVKESSEDSEEAETNDTEKDSEPSSEEDNSDEEKSQDELSDEDVEKIDEQMPDNIDVETLEVQ